jgi:uncharacterized protein (TIGR02466 family)
MQVNSKIIDIFPIPVYTVEIPDELSPVIAFFDKQEVVTDDADQANYGFRSKDSYILDKSECYDIRNFILENVKAYADVIGFDYDKYKFSQSWISIKMPGQQHVMHTHPNSLISGVFYYGSVIENTPGIEFHKSIMGVNASYIQPKIKEKIEYSRYSSPKFTMNITPGLLVLFPSYLVHNVPVNKAELPRHSLAFNVVPIIGFGDERSLTELLFKKQ